MGGSVAQSLHGLTQGMSSRNAAGFTLIETLVVVSIIGVLAAIAMPAYGAYRSNGVDAQMLSTLRTAKTATEAYYGQHGQTYVGLDETWLHDEGGFRRTPGVGFTIVDAQVDSYILRACAPGGSSPAFIVNANVGNAIPDSGSCS